MGRKHDAVAVSEPVADEAPNSPELQSEKKKKKKNKDKHQNGEKTSPKRKLEELDNQNGTESEKKKKKKKEKHNKSEENAEETAVGNGNGNADETVADGAVVVTGKDAADAKYAAVKTFKDSGLPENVMECCKGFEKPSPIQSRAWPFLLDGRDLIGIAATGSGVWSLCCCCFVAVGVWIEFDTDFGGVLVYQGRRWRSEYRGLCMFWASGRIKLPGVGVLFALFYLPQGS